MQADEGLRLRESFNSLFEMLNVREPVKTVDVYVRLSILYLRCW